MQSQLLRVWWSLWAFSPANLHTEWPTWIQAHPRVLIMPNIIWSKNGPNRIEGQWMAGFRVQIKHIVGHISSWPPWVICHISTTSACAGCEPWFCAAPSFVMQILHIKHTLPYAAILFVKLGITVYRIYGVYRLTASPAGKSPIIWS
jgi:hypothetical protein